MAGVLVRGGVALRALCLRLGGILGAVLRLALALVCVGWDGHFVWGLSSSEANLD